MNQEYKIKMNPVEKVSKLIAYNLFLGSLGSLSELHSELTKISNGMDKVYLIITANAALLKILDKDYPYDKHTEKELLRGKLIIEMGPITICIGTIIPIIIQLLTPFMGGVISTVMQDADKQTIIINKETNNPECQYSRFADSALMWAYSMRKAIQNVQHIIKDINIVY
jgi:hypothetical protein